jgi:hypothetical protein
MPMPWSSTVNSTHRPSVRVVTTTEDPESEYFTAFSTRFPNAETS